MIDRRRALVGAGFLATALSLGAGMARAQTTGGSAPAGGFLPDADLCVAFIAKNLA